MREASDKMAHASVYENPNSNKKEKTRSTAGGAEDWKEINAALKSDPGMWDLFVKNVMKSIGNSFGGGSLTAFFASSPLLLVLVKVFSFLYLSFLLIFADC
jgi:hypothetical protein